MDTATRDTGSTTARIIVTRRAQLRVRLGFAVVIVGVFQLQTGLSVALAWAALYVSLQALEFVVFRRIEGASSLTPTSRWLFFGLMMASSTAFTTFGFLEARHGIWGVACAGILWSGSIANAAIVSGESRAALVCSLLPPVLA